jgi:putative nucleotidyltransferase with HDIG domain
MDENFVSHQIAPLVAKGQVKGVLEIFQRSRLAPDLEWLDFLETLSTQAAIAIDNAGLFERLQRSNLELSLAYDTTLEGWAHALELRDQETEGHTQRVTELTLDLARLMGVSDANLLHIRRGALLHDIGKMGVPDSILLKPGPLTPDEWEIMRRHPTYAYDMLSSITYLRQSMDIPRYHHEKWDGTGYPYGLKGEQIPLSARIFTVVDVWDALCTDRPYRPAWAKEKAKAYIRQQSGHHFDPQVVNRFEEMLGQES